MSGARDQVTRLLSLVPYLNARSEVSLDQVAADFGVSPKTLVRDLNVLWFCGLPGLGPGDMIDIDMDAFIDDEDAEEPRDAETADDDSGGTIRLSNAEYLSRPLRLGSSEAAALVVALRAMRESSAEGPREVIDRALRKLEEATATGQVADVVGGPDTQEAARVAEVAVELERAVTEERQVRMDYLVPSRDESTTREVDPIAVLEAGGRRYLDGWCHLAEARRLFRLDRIESLEVLDTAALPHDVAPRDLSDGLFEPGPDDLEVRLLLAPPARWVAEYHPVETRTERPGGALEVTLRVGDPRWLVRLLLRLAPHAHVLEPTNLAEQARQVAARALERYGGQAGSVPGVR